MDESLHVRARIEPGIAPRKTHPFGGQLHLEANMAAYIKKVAGDEHATAIREELEVLHDIQGRLVVWRDEVEQIRLAARQDIFDGVEGRVNHHELMEIGREYRNTLDRIAINESIIVELVGGLEAHEGTIQEEPELKPVTPRKR